MAKALKAKTKIKVENQAISSGDCRQAIHWYTNWLAQEIESGHPANRGLFATNFESDDQLLLDTALTNLEGKGIKALVLSGNDLYKQADYLWDLALSQSKYGQPASSKLEAEIKDCQLLLLNNLDTPMSGQQLWYLYHYVLYPAAISEKPILISTPLGFEEFVMYGAGCDDFEYAGRRITWEKVISLLNATVMNLYHCKQLQKENLPAMLLPEYRFYRALQERHVNVTAQYDTKDYLTDFAIIDETARIKLDIECDFIHRFASTSEEKSLAVKQKIRDTKLIKDGWQVLRFSFKELAGSLDECVDAVEELCRNNNKKASVGRCISLPMLGVKINLPFPDNDEIAAISHSGGPAAIVGSAGTGKSICIAERIAFLLGQGVSAERILVLSYSLETIKAIKYAAEKIMPGQMLEKINFYCWHDFGMRILKENVSAIKRKLPLKIESNPQKILQKLIAKYIKELNPTSLELLGDLDEQTAQSLIAIYKANLVTAQMVKENAKNELDLLLSKVYLAYEDQMQKANKIDKEDMISLAAQLLGQEAEVRTRYENLFEHIIVDEFQDASAACDFLARVLAYPNDNIIFVGNDDETIYEGQGAAKRLLSETSIRLPNAQCYLLKRNWRSHPQMVRQLEHFVSQVIGRAGAPSRIEKTSISGWGEVTTQAIIGPYEFNEEARQCAWIIGQIEELLAQGRKPEDIAIICRSPEQVSKFEALLSPRGLFVSADSVDESLLPDEATDVLTFLKLVADPDGPKAKEQFERICQLRSRAIDAKLSATIAGFAETNNLSYLKALEIYSEIAADPFCTQLEQLVKRIRKLHEEKLAPADIINLLKRPQWLGDCYQSVKLQPGVVYEPLKVMTQMQDESRSFKTVADFVKNYAPVAGTQQTGQNRLTSLNLLTAKETKGREFQIVFLPYLMDGIFPDKDQPDRDEEERIFYVALSRAREIVYLSLAKKMNGQPYNVSPFLQDAGLDMILFDSPELAETTAIPIIVEAIPESDRVSIVEPKVIVAKSTNIFGLIQQPATEIVEEFAEMPAQKSKIDLSAAVRKARASQSKKQYCQNCQLAMEPNARFCGECGAVQNTTNDVQQRDIVEPQPASDNKQSGTQALGRRLCKECQSALEAGEKFCGTCGSQQ